MFQRDDTPTPKKNSHVNMLDRVKNNSRYLGRYIEGRKLIQKKLEKTAILDYMYAVKIMKII